MRHDKSNLRDVEFTLFEPLGPGPEYGTAPFEEFDQVTARNMPAEIEQPARENLASSFADL
ncbi:hypothetical protein [Nocardia brevicatena]|uniref:hypothetical protein n=1 Tax=Nocardia brevicatena TaxID=37327 RepID=UPI000315F124|nr:hypothetical protein [Nocardia brevicatena]